MDGQALLSRERPPYPPWLRVLPPVILVFTIGVLAMVAYVVHTVGEGKDSLGFNLFACSWGLIVTTYIILAMFQMPHIHYNYIILILSIFSCIWWLTAFAYLASDTRKVFDVIDLVNSYASLYSSLIKRAPGHITLDMAQINALLAAAASAAGTGKVKRQSTSYSSGFYGDFSSLLDGYLSAFETLKTVAKVMAGASAVGAIVWVLWMVFTIFFAIALFRSPSPGAANTAASYEPKLEQGHLPQPQPASHYQPQPASPYQQPPVYPSVPIPGSTAPPADSSYAPVKPDGAVFAAPAPAPTPTIIPVDPRQQDEIFMTPPPPPSQVNTPAPGSYVNPQFGHGQPQGGHLETQEMPDRGYTVSPLSEISEMPGSAPGTRVEMPSQH
ncbi:hypothetical protein TWF696_009135 [Orbilia brochopaga]|uniref:MARVEL domain-containing protein n=1 Tax=Orbilia brochopaga TaxID=3140254 RepID=A0AAV9UFC0_9PEZI